MIDWSSGPAVERDLKATSKATWELVNWLTHGKNAAFHDARLSQDTPPPAEKTGEDDIRALFFAGPYRGEGKKVWPFVRAVDTKAVAQLNECIVLLDVIWDYWIDQGIQPTPVGTVAFYYTSRFVRAVRSALLLLARGYHTEAAILFRQDAIEYTTG